MVREERRRIEGARGQRLSDRTRSRLGHTFGRSQIRVADPRDQNPRHGLPRYKTSYSDTMFFMRLSAVFSLGQRILMLLLVWHDSCPSTARFGEASVTDIFVPVALAVVGLILLVFQFRR